MSIRREIKTAFDTIHAPEDLVESMKQDLYQKDFHEDDEEAVSGVSQVTRRSYKRFLLYGAACAAICLVCGFSLWSLKNNQNDFCPGGPVVVEPTTEEEPSDTDATMQQEEDASLQAQEEKTRETPQDPAE